MHSFEGGRISTQRQLNREDTEMETKTGRTQVCASRGFREIYRCGKYPQSWGELISTCLVLISMYAVIARLWPQTSSASSPMPAIRVMGQDLFASLHCSQLNPSNLRSSHTLLGLSISVLLFSVSYFLSLFLYPLVQSLIFLEYESYYPVPATTCSESCPNQNPKRNKPSLSPHGQLVSHLHSAMASPYRPSSSSTSTTHYGPSG